MKLSEELQWRGFVNQTTYKDLTELDKAPISFYWGVDPSADSSRREHTAGAVVDIADQSPRLLSGSYSNIIYSDGAGAANARTDFRPQRGVDG